MTDTEQDTAPEAAEESGTPAQTVRVPNVSPNAKSGLDHTIIGANALAGAGDDADPFDHPGDDSMPQGDAEAALRWVTSAEDSDTAKARADAVWGKYGDPADSEGSSDLDTALRSAVYGTRSSEVTLDGVIPATGTGDTLLGTVTVPEGLTSEALDEWVSGDAVEGDETEHPERFAAYQARRQAAGLAPVDPAATDADES